MAPQALKGADSHAGIPTPQPGRTNTSNLLDIVIALRPVVTYHGRDRLFFFFFFFFWVTGELPILRQQEAAADARRT